MSIDYRRFNRVLARCDEIAHEPGVKSSVSTVFKKILEAEGQAFRDAHADVTKKESAFLKEEKDAVEAIEKLDQPYREARSVVMAILPTTKLPDTLKAQATDTDVLDGIETLFGILQENAAEEWAAEQLAGEFGAQAPVAIKALKKSIAANKVLAAARLARAAAYEPAYERYLRFKRVVRDALGSTSVQYRRIHVRAGHGGADDDDGGENNGGASKKKKAGGGASTTEPTKTQGGTTGDAKKEGSAPADTREKKVDASAPADATAKKADGDAAAKPAADAKDETKASDAAAPVKVDATAKAGDAAPAPSSKAKPATDAVTPS